MTRKILQFVGMLALALLLGSLLAARPTHAAGVVGNGTPASCTEAAFEAALAGGGTVTFNCGPNPHTITITSRKTISSETTIDGNGRITLNGGGNSAILALQAEQTLTLRGLTFRESTADDTGAVYVGFRATLNVSNTIFEENGKIAIFNGGGTVTVANSIFRDNSTTFGIGAAIDNENAGTVTVSDSIFEGNRAGNGGGAISSGEGGTLTVANSRFEGNSSSGRGGAIDSGEKLTVTRSTFTNNEALSGGAIYSAGNSTITYSTIQGNRATTNFGGGIVHFNQAQGAHAIRIEQSTISGNTSQQGGGGIFFSAPEGTLHLVNSTIEENAATTGGGGGLGVRFGTVVVTNVTITNNTSAENDAANINNADEGQTTAAVTLRNTIVAEGGCIGPINAGSSNLNFNAPNCVAAAPVDPQLGALEDNGGWSPTRAIAEDSPARDAGNNSFCPDLDQRGVIRPQNGTCDIGAFEWGAKPVLATIAPTEVAAGGPAFNLTVTGTNFIPGPKGTRVLWNGEIVPTILVSPTELRARVPAALIEEPGTATIKVITPVIDGGESDASRTITIIEVQTVYLPLVIRAEQ
jgi:predicted outer membrane repeat protein